MAKSPEFRIRVKDVKYHDEKTKFTVLEAILMKKGRRGYRDTKKKAIFTGSFLLAIPNDQFDIEANLVEHKKYGSQYEVTKYHRIEPGTIEEIRKFLINSTKGLGTGKANKLIEDYGLDTLYKLRDDPMIIEGLHLSDKAKSALKEALSYGEVFEELLFFFQLHKFDQRYIGDIYSCYKEYAFSKLKDDPYSVYMDGVIPFKLADDIAFVLNIPYNSCGRVKATILACIRKESEIMGNLYVKRHELFVKCMKFLFSSRSRYNEFPPISEAELEKALSALYDQRALMSTGMGAGACIYLTENLKAEDGIITHLKDIMDGPKRFAYNLSEIEDTMQKVSSLPPAIEQKNAVVAALTTPVSILTGGPGTGKTQTVSTILNTIKALSPSAVISMCAPTGKAAVRMQELTGGKSSTIHRLLGIGNPQHELGVGELMCDFLIVDEFSMVDVQLCERLFRSVCTYARIIIVGDDDQLPSVGPGLVLRDLIDSGIVSTTKLTKVFRQSGDGSRIVKNAHSIINQKPGAPIMLSFAKKPGEDFYFIDADTPSKVRSLVVASEKKLMESYHIGLDQIGVFSPVYAGEIGVDMLNQTLRDSFNPTGEEYEIPNGNSFRVGDKVIQTKNNYDLSVFNGEQGIIKEFGYTSEGAICVEFKDKDVWYPETSVTELELAYAISVHRSQGSEYKAVIIPVHDVLVRTLNVSLLYTAITRAKGIVILVGDKKAFSEGLRRQPTERYSQLSAKLKDSFSSISCVA